MNPTVSIMETISYPIEKIEFPTVTLCPENSNAERFGPAIQVLDYFQRKCSNVRYVRTIYIIKIILPIFYKNTINYSVTNS